MKEYICIYCGFNHEGEGPPEVCPICGSDSSKFSVDGDINRDQDNK